jgi:hypothetical protein
MTEWLEQTIEGIEKYTTGYLQQFLLDLFNGLLRQVRS